MNINENHCFSFEILQNAPKSIRIIHFFNICTNSIKIFISFSLFEKSMTFHTSLTFLSSCEFVWVRVSSCAAFRGVRVSSCEFVWVRVVTLSAQNRTSRRKVLNRYENHRNQSICIEFKRFASFSIGFHWFRFKLKEIGQIHIDFIKFNSNLIQTNWFGFVSMDIRSFDKHSGRFTIISHSIHALSRCSDVIWTLTREPLLVHSLLGDETKM